MKTKQSTVKIQLKNQSTIELSLQSITIENEGFDANLLMTQKETAFLLEKKHSYNITTINLTQVTPYVILQFDENKEFTGATFSLNEMRSPFYIKALAEYFLLLPYPLQFHLDEIAGFEINTINQPVHQEL
jgi:hypothetical protein